MMPLNTVDDAYLDKRTVTLAESGCWVWMLSTIKGGYGKITVGGDSKMAHRAVWEKRRGPIPEGMILCHRCDVPSCVNPDHMFLGSYAENSADMVSKGRSAKGERVSLAKLDALTVREIRQEVGTYKDISQKYDVSPGTIRDIKLGLTWRHVA
jgi:hypothetical protein